MLDKIKQKISGAWSWTKKKAKWVLFTVLSIGTVYAVGETIIPDHPMVNIETLEMIIESDRQNNGKYKKLSRRTINGIDYDFSEYETSKGEVGYVIYLTKEDKDGIYKKVANYGPETYREKDWFTYLDKTPFERTTSTQ